MISGKKIYITLDHMALKPLYKLISFKTLINAQSGVISIN